jgi:hypothetical protein
MRTLTPVLLVVLLTGVASAQTVDLSGPPGVTVLQSKWGFNIRNPKLDEDPMRVNDEYREYERVQKETMQLNKSARQAGLPAKYAARNLSYQDLPTGAQVTYTYSVKIRNAGEKTVQAVVWTYIFFDPDTQKEIGHHQHTSKVKIRPGKSEELIGSSASPPIQVIDARRATGELPDQISERVLIKQIEYTDGSIWQRSSK